MGRIDPTNGRNGDEVMTEIDEDVDFVPLRENVGVAVVRPLEEAVVVITPRHVVAKQSSGAAIVVAAEKSFCALPTPESPPPMPVFVSLLHIAYLVQRLNINANRILLKV